MADEEKRQKLQSSRDVVVRRVIEARRLRNEGLTMRAVAEKMRLPISTISYYFYKANNEPNSRGNVKVKKGEANHVRDNGKNENYLILIGVAYAETERFIATLAERLGVPAEILRPRLSKLLGHPPVR